MKATAVTLFVLFATVAAGAVKPTVTLDGPVYIEPAQGFETYLAAAMTHKHVPAQFTDDKNAARYILRSSSQSHPESTGGKIARCLFAYCAGIEGNSTASVSLIDATTHTIVWSYEVRKGGAYNYQSRSEAVAKHLKHFLGGEGD
jgi:hypothetical protein